MAYSSEALKKDIKPPKDLRKMNANARKKWLKTLNPDEMGFDGREGCEVNEVKAP